MRVKVNNTETERAAERARLELLGVLPDRMLNAVRQGAEYEKSRKTYQDRTGKLRSSTVGRMDNSNANNAQVTLEMGEEYASYVNRMGFSAIDEAAKATSDAIADAIEDIGERVTGR